MATPTTEPWQRACSGELVDVDLEGEGGKVGELGFVQGVEGDHYHLGAAMNGRCVADLAMDKRATATAPCMNREKKKTHNLRKNYMLRPAKMYTAKRVQQLSDTSK